MAYADALEQNYEESPVASHLSEGVDNAANLMHIDRLWILLSMIQQI